jgi:hypothetical protein
MIRILNFLSSIGSYFGPGAVILIIGIAIIIIASVKLSRLNKAERRRTVAEFNQQFVMDTGSRISDVEAASRRKAIAGELGIKDSK